MILVYVDNIIVTGNEVNYLTQLIKDLNFEISFKDLGNLHFFPKVELHMFKISMQLTQSKYIKVLLQKN